MARNTETIGCGYITYDVWRTGLDEASEEHQTVAAHIACCPRCRSAVDHWQLIAAGLTTMSPASPAVKSAFVQSVLVAHGKSLQATRPHPHHGRRLWQWAGALTTAVAACVLVLFISRQPVTPVPQIGAPLRVSSVSMVVDDEMPLPGYIVPHHITHVRDDSTADVAASSAAIRVAHGHSIQ